MKNNTIALLSTALICALPAAAGPAPAALTTQVNVEVGFPQKAAVAGERVEIAPGTVLALAEPGATPNPGQRSAAVSRLVRYLRLCHRLISTFRLDYARMVASQRLVTLQPGGAASIPIPVKSNVTIKVRQVSADAHLAGYRVVFRQGAKVLADTPVSIVPGSRAVVGAMDGPAAPYLFVTLQPIPQGEEIPVRFTKAGLTEPKAIKKAAPVYPEDARKEKVTGIVVLETVIGEDGTVQNVTPLRSPDERLTKAAVAAVHQWKFEPARDNAGHAVPVIYVLTTRFVLQ